MHFSQTLTSSKIGRIRNLLCFQLLPFGLCLVSELLSKFKKTRPEISRFNVWMACYNLKKRQTVMFNLTGLALAFGQQASPMF